MLPLQAAAYDPAQAPRYNSPDLYRPNLDGVILRGDSSRGNVSGTSVVPSLGALDGTLARVVAWLSGVSTVADLRGSPRGAYFRAVSTLGFYAAGDGGGASYRFDPTDKTSADNGCTVLVGADGARWKLDWKVTIDLRQCGAKGDDTTDDTARVQAAFSAAAALGAEISVPTVAAGKGFKLTSTVTVSGAPLRVRGSGIDPGNLQGSRGVGSWFHLAHAGVGFLFQNTGYAGANELVGIGTYRDQPAPAAGWAPLAADYDVVLSAAESVVDMTMLNATKGLKVTGNVGMRTWVKRLRGQFMQNALLIERANDKNKIDYVDAWPYWQNTDFVNSYTANNLDTVIMQRVDGLDGGYLFTIFAKSALRYSQLVATGAGTGVASEHSWKAVYADNARTFLTFDAGAQYANLHIGWGTMYQDPYSTGAHYGIENNGAPNVSVAIDDWKANNLRGGAAYMTGAGALLSIGTFHEGQFNRAGTGAPAFVAVNGAQVRIGQYLRANAAQTIYGAGALAGVTGWSAPNGGAPRAGGTGVFATFDVGFLSSTTSATGQFAFPHNVGQTPNDVQLSPSPSCPDARLYYADATTLGVRCSDASGAALVNATVSLTYRAGMVGRSLPTSNY
ncbi:hypothetical protein [Methylobacterium sp. UNCCL125]|uniref:hypothetical protein n=3 Tax=Pseudomonadota TaxID=1224 RepID=UPI0008E4CB1E|nr:hypothetical protein [Methylobacterium sp. UNCCL125]SFV07905.1 hypothetical protein SAMN02799643_04823 [Methylobacterium sp. UNCCL125]